MPMSTNLTISTDQTFDNDDQESSEEDEIYEEYIEAPKHIGRIRCFLPDKDAKPRITVGPTWMFSIPLIVIVIILTTAQIFLLIKG